MKTLDALRPQPLTSEHYCPLVAVAQGGAALHGAVRRAVRCKRFAADPLELLSSTLEFVAAEQATIRG